MFLRNFGMKNRALFESPFFLLRFENMLRGSIAILLVTAVVVYESNFFHLKIVCGNLFFCFVLIFKG